MRAESLRGQLLQFPNFDGLWNSMDLSLVETQLREKLSQTETQNDRKRAISLLTYLARVLSFNSFFKEAAATLDQARQILVTGPSFKPFEVRVLIEEGRHHSLSGNIRNAQNCFALAMNLASETHQDYFVVEASFLLSLVVPAKDQNQWLRQALKVAQNTESSDTKFWLPHIYLASGWHAFDFRAFVEAHKFFELARDCEVLPSSRFDSDAGVWAIARVLRALGRTVEALRIQEGLLAKGHPSGVNMGHIYLELAECHQLLQNHSEAKSNFEKAHLTLSIDPWYANNKIDDLSRMKAIAKKK
ncbi:MAG: hypothetical protein A4S09_01045 [Proteobacteria bacterium SG_bin7]|nr:MAG: hypothetical protein A4S09_01045 [Proteobacteria bacterium SG_bin7]